jgi:hypothetical protein
MRKFSWDIVDEFFSGSEPTETTPSGGSNAWARAVLPAVRAVLPAVMLAGLATSSQPIQVTELGGISPLHAVVFRAERQRPKPLSARQAIQQDEGRDIDFKLGRSGEKLARAFDTYLRPSTEPDVEPDETCIF